MRAPYLQPLELNNPSKPRQWRLLEDYALGGFVAPQGFIFDGASVPKVVWNVVSPTGILFLPAIFHDFAYRHGLLLSDPDRAEVKVSRRFADELLRDLALELHGDAWRARMRIRTAYRSVRMFGGLSWQGV